MMDKEFLEELEKAIKQERKTSDRLKIILTMLGLLVGITIGKFVL